ncbi:hypothetical protein [Clostridium rectalis]|uniref:hypothetical protein n=1 Tax=Clostridium rectalis TaxID=2040295 RepID=UPI000F63DDDF|nr:hypothetical protein [Clostridium rectalis]
MKDKKLETEERKRVSLFQLEEYAKNYNLTIQKINDTIIVISLFDEWFIEPFKNNLFVLHHYNKKNTNSKGKFHKQGIFYSYFSAIRHIAEHDKNKLII